MKRLLCVLLCMALLMSGITVVSAAPAADAPVMDGKTLITFGDSITALSTWPRSVAKGTNMHLINAGIGGNTSEQGRARFDRDVMNKNPDFVIMSFATNDFYPEDGVNPRVTVARYKENLHYFIDRIEAAGAVPILMTPPFLAEFSQGGSDRYTEGSVNLALDKYVVAMREVASEAGAHLIDMHAVCDSGYDLNTFLIADGLHLADQGNQVYTDTIVAYLKNHFNQDPSAPRVTTNDPPAMQSGSWTKDIVSYDAADWLVLFPGTMNVTANDDNSLTFANTTGKWPEVHYSPGFSQMLYAPVQGTTLTLDLELTAAANISLYFDGPTPTHESTNTSVAIAQIVASHNPSVVVSGDDICGGQNIRVSLPLSAIVPTKYIRSDGSVLLSGVKMFVSGAAGAPVVINEMSVTVGDPALPYCKDVASLLPTAYSAVSQNEGVVDYTVDGALTLARAASSDIAWPSVKVTCGQTVDLHKTPYLHLNMTVDGGSANGFLNYTDAYGNQGSVRLSELVNGNADDFAADLDTYVDLASAIGTGGTVTIDSYTLSVYGLVGDSVTWDVLSTARDASGDIQTGDVDKSGEINTLDARSVLYHVLGSELLDTVGVQAADMNGDGDITTADAREILIYVVNQ